MSAPDVRRASRRRAAGVIAVAVVVAAGCVLAGLWQWGRHQGRSAEVALVDANYDAAVVPVDQLLADALDADDVWRPVTVTGRYVGSAVLRNRPVSGTPAVHALGVLEVTQGPLAGRLLVVDRGWLPAAQTPPAPPGGTVELVGRLRAAEAPSDRSAPPGQVRRVDPGQVVDVAGATGDPLRAYVALAEEGGGPPAAVTPLPRPVADLGPHLSYAFQWWVFAVGALVGAVVLLRRDAHEMAAVAAAAGRADAVGGPPSPGTGPGRPGHGRRPPSRRRPTAEDEEDALLDAAERAVLDTGRLDGSRLDGTAADGAPTDPVSGPPAGPETSPR